MSLHFVAPFYATSNLYDFMIIMKQFRKNEFSLSKYRLYDAYRQWLAMGPVFGLISHLGKYLRFLDPENEFFTHSNPLFYPGNLNRKFSYTSLIVDYALIVIPNAITTIHLSTKIFQSKEVPYSSKWILGVILCGTGFVILQNRILFYLYHTKETGKEHSQQTDWRRRWHWNLFLLHLIRHFIFIKYSDLLCDEYNIRLL